MTDPVLKSVEYACPICGDRFSGTGWEADWLAHTKTCTQELADGKAELEEAGAKVELK